MPAYAFTIFSGAFLLFQVQPLMGKYVLPWFGGGPGVWTACMLFFQVVLLGGYAYAHFTTRWLKPHRQLLLHLGLLLLAVLMLPIIPAEKWKPHGQGSPVLQILLLLGACLGLPYFVLSTTGPLLQQWFSRSFPGRSPYRLYALSNAGSLLALLSYPFYLESHLTRKAQGGLWAAGFVAYVLCCGFCAVRLWKGQGQRSEFEVQSAKCKVQSAEPVNSQPSTISCLLWLLLPACASVLLLAVTNKLCQDVAVIPFLWVVPLALYLLSFILCFDNPRWYGRIRFGLALFAALGGVCWALSRGADWVLWKQIAMYCAGLFICCMVCHGELYRLRPDPSRLTGFYLMSAAGGALGGLMVAAGGPLLFTNYYELHWGLLLCGGLFALVVTLDAAAELKSEARDGTEERAGRSERANPKCETNLKVEEERSQTEPFSSGSLEPASAGCGILTGPRRAEDSPPYRDRFVRWCRLLACVALWAGVGVLGIGLRREARESAAEAVYTSRNFYGVLSVCEYRKDEPQEHYFLLQHGRITHGLQFVEAGQALQPTTYYGEQSGVGLALKALAEGHRRIGLVGLGTGTLTAYAKAGDYLRIYEINPEVKQLAHSRFSYLNHCAGQVDVVLGDARLSMEREPPQQFDLLALDAFSSDSIPVHLLTREAFELYERHLKPNGIVAVHISNHFLDLEPVVRQLARQFHYQVAMIDYEETEEEWWLYSSTWLLLSRDEAVLQLPEIRDAACPGRTHPAQVPLWTDDFASLFQILK